MTKSQQPVPQVLSTPLCMLSVLSPSCLLQVDVGRDTKLRDMDEKHMHNLFLKNMSGLIEETKNPSPCLNPWVGHTISSYCHTQKFRNLPPPSSCPLSVKCFLYLDILDIHLDKEESLMYYWLQEQQEGRDGDTRGRGAGARDREAAGGEEQVSRYPQLLSAGCLASGLNCRICMSPQMEAILIWCQCRTREYEVTYLTLSIQNDVLLDRDLW